jgi:hypothetical protein
MQMLQRFVKYRLQRCVACEIEGHQQGDIDMTKTLPKRSLRRNIWGNLVGYEAGKRVEEFGDAFCQWNQSVAQAWAERREG